MKSYESIFLVKKKENSVEGSPYVPFFQTHPIKHKAGWMCLSHLQVSPQVFWAVVKHWL